MTNKEKLEHFHNCTSEECHYGNEDCPVIEFHTKTYEITEADYLFLVAHARLGIVYLSNGEKPMIDDDNKKFRNEHIEEIHYKIGYKSNPNDNKSV